MPPKGPAGHQPWTGTMMRRGGRAPAAFLSLVLVLGLAPQPASAALGYFLNGSGANMRALAGTGAAVAEDAMTVALNPANIVNLPGGDQWQVGVTLLWAGLGFTASKFTPPVGGLQPGAFPIRPGTYNHDPDVPLQFAGIFPIPTGAVSWQLDEDSAFAIGVYGNGGLNNTYPSFDNPSCPPATPQRGVFCFGTLASDIMQTFIAPTYARQVTPRLRLGASVLLVWQVLEIRGLQLFAPHSRAPDKLTNNGHDNSFGLGAKVGAQFRITPTLYVGGFYQMRSYMEPFDDYAGLLAEQGDFDVPPQAQVGIAWDVSPRWRLLFDVQKIWYTEVDTLANAQVAPGRLGDDNGPGLDWDDITAYKLGVRYRHNREWTFRFGYAVNNSVLPDPLLLDLITIATFDEHVSAGLSYNFDDKYSIDVAAVWAVEEAHKGPNPLFPQQTIEGHNELITFDLTLRRRF